MYIGDTPCLGSAKFDSTVNITCRLETIAGNLFLPLRKIYKTGLSQLSAFVKSQYIYLWILPVHLLDLSKITKTLASRGKLSY
jgi:hypothetical protein